MLLELYFVFQAEEGIRVAHEGLEFRRVLLRSWLGTDDQARDVAARLIYGFRISVLFGLTLTLFSTVVGVAAGALQGYFGGWFDLIFQRFMEIWSGLPQLFLLIILAAMITPNLWWLLGIMLLFSWLSIVGVGQIGGTTCRERVGPAG